MITRLALAAVVALAFVLPAAAHDDHHHHPVVVIHHHHHHHHNPVVHAIHKIEHHS